MCLQLLNLKPTLNGVVAKGSEMKSATNHLLSSLLGFHHFDRNKAQDSRLHLTDIGLLAVGEVQAAHHFARLGSQI